MGTPIFRHAVMIRGMVARDDETFEWYGDRYVEIVHIDATVRSGMSGGHWFNGRGEIVGVQTGVMSSQGGAGGIAYMVPHKAIQSLLANQRTAATAAAVASRIGLLQSAATRPARARFNMAGK